MKKTTYCIMAVIFSVILCFCMIFSACSVNNSGEEGKLLRIHIRANSNSAEDQAVKMEVKAAVVRLLEDKLSRAASLDDAIAIVRSQSESVRRVADSVLSLSGFDYTSSVRVTNEYFPTRVYESVVVESGVYDALIIELGSGSGDNWWCVIYPPLCFVGRQPGEEEIHYKSRLVEWFRKIFYPSS